MTSTGIVDDDYYRSTPMSSVDSLICEIQSKLQVKVEKNMIVMKSICNSDDDISMPTSLSNDDDLVREILSRLPVKSLMRFKTVSKYWLSLIQDDPHFSYLHLTQSEKCPHVLALVPLESEQSFLSIDMSEGSTTVHNIEYDCMLGPVNGLICFVSNERDSVCIYNLSTREVSPWIKTTVIKEEHGVEVRPSAYYGFGFNSASKEHKVICVWHIQRVQTFPEYRVISEDLVCEVLTVGHSSWRRIDEVVPDYVPVGSSAYANGSIYWGYVMRHDQWWGNFKNEVILAFDVGSEKFRVIPTPNFIWDQPHDEVTIRDYIFSSLVASSFEVDERLGLTYKVNSYMVKLWMLDDGDKEISNTTTNSDWIEETISLPFTWDKNRDVYFQAIAGTDQIIVTSYILRKKKLFTSVHSYDRKKKTFNKVNTGWISSVLCRDDFGCEITTFVESLLNVGKQQ